MKFGECCSVSLWGGSAASIERVFPRWVGSFLGGLPRRLKGCLRFFVLAVICWGGLWGNFGFVWALRKVVRSVGFLLESPLADPTAPRPPVLQFGAKAMGLRAVGIEPPPKPTNGARDPAESLLNHCAMALQNLEGKCAVARFPARSGAGHGAMIKQTLGWVPCPACRFRTNFGSHCPQCPAKSRSDRARTATHHV